MPAAKSPEFRRRAVELARLGEKPIAQIAKDGSVERPTAHRSSLSPTSDAISQLDHPRDQALLEIRGAGNLPVARPLWHNQRAVTALTDLVLAHEHRHRVPSLKDVVRWSTPRKKCQG